MSETTAVLGPLEMSVEQGSNVSLPSVPVEFSGKPEDFAKDMAAIAKEMGQPEQPIQPQAPVTNPIIDVKPVIATQQEVKPVEVPDKFRGPNGELDQEKVLKSYFEAEKTLKRLQNKGQQSTQQVQQAVPQVQPAPTQSQTQLTPFEIQVAEDLIREGLPQNLAIPQARVMVKMMEAKHQADTAATFSEIQSFRETLAEQAQRSELQSLAKSNPWVLTPKGMEELNKVRDENPWMNSAPQPWRAATMFLLGQKTLNSGEPVNIPNPSGGQQPLPVTPAQQNVSPIKIETRDQLNAHLNTLSPEEEAKYWKSQGYNWQVQKTYKGI